MKNGQKDARFLIVKMLKNYPEHTITTTNKLRNPKITPLAFSAVTKFLLSSSHIALKIPMSFSSSKKNRIPHTRQSRQDQEQNMVENMRIELIASSLQRIRAPQRIPQ